MGSIRLLVAALVLALAVAVLGWAWFHADDADTMAGDHAIRVIGPEGLLYNGTVHTESSTALSVLQAAGAQGNFEVRVQEYGAYGGRDCDGSYVYAIGVHEAHGASGWEYRVFRAASQAWESPGESAGCVALLEGDQVEWHWTAASAI